MIIHSTTGDPAFTGFDAVVELCKLHGKTLDALEWLDHATFRFVGNAGVYRLSELSNGGWSIAWGIPK